MRLDQATDFQGTCVDMCPEWEREEREYQNNVDPLERVRHSGPSDFAVPDDTDRLDNCSTRARPGSIPLVL